MTLYSVFIWCVEPCTSCPGHSSPAPFRDTNPFIDRLHFTSAFTITLRLAVSFTLFHPWPLHKVHGILGTAIEKINGTILNHRLSLLDMTSVRMWEDVGETLI